MTAEQLAMGAGGFLVGLLAVLALIAVGFEDAPGMVMVSGVVASTVLGIFRFAANLKR